MMIKRQQVQLGAITLFLGTILFSLLAFQANAEVDAPLDPTDWGAPGTQVSTNGQDATSPKLIVHPSDRNKMALIYLVDTGGDPGNEVVYGTATTDGGDNWFAPIDLTNGRSATAKYLVPDAAFDATGRAHFSFLETDGGDTKILHVSYNFSSWSSITELDTVTGQVLTQAITASGNEVSAMWATPAPGALFQLIQSSNNGSNWGGVADLAAPSLDTVNDIDLETDSSGNLLVVYQATTLVSFPTPQEIRSAYFFKENSGTFQADFKITSVADQDGDIVTSSIARSGNEVMVAWGYVSESDNNTQSAFAQECDLTTGCDNTGEWSIPDEISLGNQSVAVGSPFFIEPDVASSNTGRFYAFYHGVSDDRQSTKNETIQGTSQCSFGTVDFVTTETNRNLFPSIDVTIDSNADDLVVMAYEDATDSKIYFVNGTVACIVFVPMMLN